MSDKTSPNPSSGANWTLQSSEERKRQWARRQDAEAAAREKAEALADEAYRARFKALIFVGLVLAIPVLLSILVAGGLFFVALSPCLAIVSFQDSRIGWEPFRKFCIGGIVACPFVTWILFQGMPWPAFLVMCGISAASLAVVLYSSKWGGLIPAWKNLAAKSASATLVQGQGLSGGSGTATRKSTTAAPVSQAAPQAQEDPSVKVEGSIAATPPIIATTTERQTEGGVEYTVTWTDFAKLTFWDRYYLLYVLPVATFYLGTLSVGLWGDTAKLAQLVMWLFAAASVGIWIYKFYHERDRYSVRSLVIRPDGSILFQNPPSNDANHRTDGPSLTVENALSRLTSIEYTKTADWLWIMPQCVRSVEHWYEVHFLLGEEWRISVSRNLGSRDHAHQITGHLNRLKAKLTRPQAAPNQAQSRVLD